MRGLLLIGVIAAVGMAVLKGGQRFVDRLKMQVVKLTIDSAATKKSLFLTLFYTLTLRFTNNEPFVAEIKSMALDVFLGDRNVGTLSKGSPFKIPARDAVEVQLDASVRTLQLGLSIADITKMITGGKPLPSVTVRGYLLTALGRIEVNQVIPVTI